MGMRVGIIERRWGTGMGLGSITLKRIRREMGGSSERILSRRRRTIHHYRPRLSRLSRCRMDIPNPLLLRIRIIRITSLSLRRIRFWGIKERRHRYTKNIILPTIRPHRQERRRRTLRTMGMGMDTQRMKEEEDIRTAYSREVRGGDDCWIDQASPCRFAGILKFGEIR